MPVTNFRDFMALFKKAADAGEEDDPGEEEQDAGGAAGGAIGEDENDAAYENMAHEKTSERWEVGVLPLSATAAGGGGGSGGGAGGGGGSAGLQHVSFVNSMATPRGGK